MHSELNRRQLLRTGLGGALGALLMRSPLAAAPSGARACIIVWLDGGPSQLETFDPKPGTRNGGPTKAIATRVKGLRFAEHLPALAERANELAVVRSLTSREGDHARARHLLHTGFVPQATVRHPTWGSVVGAELKGRRDVPAFVSLGPDQVGPGYLGAVHGAYVVEGQGGALKPLRGSTRKRRESRRELLELIEAPFARAAGIGDARSEALGRATDMLEGPMREALEVSRESSARRTAYGEDDFGRKLLAARRLVEAGVRCVEARLGGWDDHQDIFGRLPARCRSLDRALAALLDDLAERDLLERTLVVCMGEFGRTPSINGNSGRDHYPGAFSALLAGGGVRSGCIVGETSADGTQVTRRPVRVPDLFATLATLQGLDPKARRYAGERPITLVDGGTPIRELIAL